MRILYGVAGEGMGHATRSKVIIAELAKEHEVIVLASQRAYRFLAACFPQVHEIAGERLVYGKGRVKRVKTILSNLWAVPRVLRVNSRQAIEMLRRGWPQVIISDFESFSGLLALARRTPLISIDNIQIISRCKVEVPRGYKRDYYLTRLVIRSRIFNARHYLITTFFYPEVSAKGTYLFPPVLRDEILQAPRHRGEHILVYQTAETYEELLPVLRSIDEERFFIYGLKSEGEDGNLSFRAFDESRFTRDLASARAVITNGGFSLIAEAIYLGKPILSVPIKKQFEQVLNGLYVERLGYGASRENIDRETVREFLSHLESFEQSLATYRQDGNRLLLSKLHQLLADCQPAGRVRPKHG
jgi:uncharacterized protein (TIGR00661 family)